MIQYTGGTSAFFTGVDRINPTYCLLTSNKRCYCRKKLRKNASVNPPPYEVRECFTETKSRDLEEKRSIEHLYTVNKKDRKESEPFNKNFMNKNIEKTKGFQDKKKVSFKSLYSSENTDPEKARGNVMSIKKNNTNEIGSPVKREKKDSAVKIKHKSSKGKGEHTKNVSQPDSIKEKKIKRIPSSDEIVTKTETFKANMRGKKKDVVELNYEKRDKIKEDFKYIEQVNKTNMNPDLKTNNKKQVISIKRNRCIEGVCVDALKNKDIDFICKCEKRNQILFNCNDDTCKRYPSSIDSNTTIDKIKRTICCLCRKYCRKLRDKENQKTCQQGVCKIMINKGKGFICKCVKEPNVKECSDETCSRFPPMHNRSDQTAEPFFEIKLNTVDMSLLNSSVVIDKIKTLGKKVTNEATCICPSHAKFLSRNNNRNLCLGRICAMKNKKTNFTCKCLNKRILRCSGDNCKSYMNKNSTKKIRYLKARPQLINENIPLFEMKLNPDKQNVINANEVKQKLMLLNMDKGDNTCVAGICRENIGREDVQTICVCKSRHVPLECTRKTCEASHKSSESYFLKLLSPKRKPKIQTSKQIATSSATKWYRGLKSSKSDNTHTRDGLKITIKSKPSDFKQGEHETNARFKSNKHRQTIVNTDIGIRRNYMTSKRNRVCEDVNCNRLNTNKPTKVIMNSCACCKCPPKRIKIGYKSMCCSFANLRKRRLCRVYVESTRNDPEPNSVTRKETYYQKQIDCNCCICRKNIKNCNCSQSRLRTRCTQRFCSSITAFMKRKRQNATKESPVNDPNKVRKTEPKLVKAKETPEKREIKVVNAKNQQAKGKNIQPAVVNTNVPKKRVASTVKALPKPILLKVKNNTWLNQNECQCKTTYEKIKKTQKLKAKKKLSKKAKPKKKPKKHKKDDTEKKKNALEKKKQRIESNKKLKQSLATDKKHTKTIERKERAERKKQWKLQKQQIMELEAQMRGKSELQETSCCAEFLLGVLKLGVTIVTIPILILLRILTQPKLSYMYMKMRLRDPLGTYERMKRWMSDKWQLKKMKMARAVGGSETMTILGDTIVDSSFYQAFATKGRTKAEKQEIQTEQKRRKDRIRKRNNRAVYGCRHMLLTTLRKTPCLWVYHICPGFYPQCLSFLAFIRNFSNVMLFCLAFICWTPCILLCEMCRACMCCLMCTQ